MTLKVIGCYCTSWLSLWWKNYRSSQKHTLLSLKNIPCF